jgi:adenylate cyclase, class 2
MTMGKHREIEVKLRVDGVARLTRALKALPAKQTARVYEQDTLFDTADRFFQKREAIMRLRTCTRVAGRAVTGANTRRRGKATEGSLTFKGLVKGASPAGGHYKEREEIEFRIGNVARFAGALRRIGMRPWFRYEKYRTTYTSGRYPGLKFELDETPIGFFLELEGPKRQIRRAAEALGYSRADYITASYLELYAAERPGSRSKSGNMLFHKKKIAKL